MPKRNIRVTTERRQEGTLRLKALSLQIKSGVDALERGDFVEVDDADLDKYLGRLASPAAKGMHARDTSRSPTSTERH